jgi:hypothetical protein
MTGVEGQWGWLFKNGTTESSVEDGVDDRSIGEHN